MLETITIDRVLSVVSNFRVLQRKTIDVIASVRANVKRVIMKVIPKKM